MRGTLLAAVHMRTRLVATIGLLSALWVGCDGCDKKGPISAPTRYIPADAEVVLEVADVGVGLKAREAVLAIPGVEESPVDAAIVGIVEGVELAESGDGAHP